MTDRPINFSAPMVRALLDGRKTQTRRVVLKGIDPNKCEPPYFMDQRNQWCWRDGEMVFRAAPEKSGDRLYVREAFSIVASSAGATGDVAGERSYEIEYRCDNSARQLVFAGSPANDAYLAVADRQRGDWQPSIHMPRWGSRLTLIVEGVKVERLQAISRGDAIAEGIQRLGGGMLRWENWTGADGQSATSPEAAYALLWNSLHGAGSWDANPFVVALTFRVELGNIDQLARAA